MDETFRALGADLVPPDAPNGKLAGGLLEYAKKWLRDNGADETVL